MTTPLDPIPTAISHHYKPHTVTKKPQGLDWDALTPVCGLCGQRSGTVDLATRLCVRCATPAPVVLTAVAKVTRKTASTRPDGVVPRSLIRSNQKRRDEEIVRMYNNGARATAIAVAFNLHDSTIRTILRNNGIEIRNDRGGTTGTKTRDKDYVATICRMYQTGANTHTIRMAMRCSSKTVLDILRAQGVEIRPAGTAYKAADKTTLARVVAAHYAGAGVREIAKNEGVSTAVVSRWLAQGGVTPRPGPAVMRQNREQIKAEVSRLREEGMSVRKTAAHLGISVTTVERMMREMRDTA